MSVSAIYCVDKNGLLGFKDDHFFQSIDCPEDKKYFQQITKGKTIVMGGNTARSLVYEIGGLLPGRTHVVLTQDQEFRYELNFHATKNPGQLVKVKYFGDIRSLKQYLTGQEEEVFVIGGASLIDQLSDVIEKYYVTEFDYECNLIDGCDPIYVPVIGSCKTGEVKEGFTRVECKKFEGDNLANGERIQGYFGIYTV